MFQPRKAAFAGAIQTIRVWAKKFGPQIAANLKRRRQNPSPRWHLDESVPRRLPSVMWVAELHGR